VLRRAFLVAAASACVLISSAAASAQEAERPLQEPRPQVVLSGNVVVPRGRVVGEVVVFHGSATIGGVAAGDVIVLDGPVTVGGQVAGDVIAFDGPVRLQGTAQVGGQVLAGGEVTAADGAEVAGGVRQGLRVTLSGPAEVLGALLAAAAMAASTLVVLLALLLLAPRGLDRVASAARTAPLASFGWGLVATIALPAAAVVLAASVVGLPLGLALLLALALVGLVGLVAAAFAVGRLLVGTHRSRIAALFAGWGVVAVLGLVPFLNVAVWGIGAVFGVGTILVAAWRARGTSKHRLGGVPFGTAPLPSTTRED
jgi:hypothetical protein